MKQKEILDEHFNNEEKKRVHKRKNQLQRQGYFFLGTAFFFAALIFYILNEFRPTEFEQMLGSRRTALFAMWSLVIITALSLILSIFFHIKSYK